MTATDRALRELIERRRATVGIIGLGYVGLPLAMTVAEAGFPVIGFDVDRKKVATLERGDTYITHVAAARITAARGDRRFAATSNLERLSEPDVLVICVPTPLTDGHEPDLRHVVRTGDSIAAALRRGQLVVLESTTYPGTTDEVLRRRLDASGLACGRDYFLAYSPEREDPGNPDYATRSIPKLVGGVDEISSDLAKAFYDRVVVRTVPVSHARVAEAAKLTENIFRAVNIALVNELKVVYDRLGIDVWEVLDAAATKPFGFQRFDPGPGWGGHCIPIDPFYLAWLARREGTQARFIELAGEINVLMPRFVVGKLERALEERGKTLAASRILLLGLAYKRDVADPRESPAFELISLLRERGATISYHDPLIPVMPQMRHWPDLDQLESSPLEPAVLESQDAVIVVTAHSGVDYHLVERHAPLIVDTRGVFRAASAKLVRS